MSDELSRAEQELARQQGRYIGIGFSTYSEICGLGPSKVAGISATVRRPVSLAITK